MATKRRSYSDACGVARALDTMGERWALMIVRELLLGPKRFSDIRHGLPTLSPDVLTQRLRDLEESGVLVRRTLPPPAASQVYELTPKGLALEPVLIELGRWGGANAAPPTEDMSMSLDAHLVSLRTLFDPERAGDMDATIQLRIEEQPFRVAIGGGEIVVERGEAAAPDATLTTDAATLLSLTHGPNSPQDVVAAGDARIDGDGDLVATFVTLFPLPAAA